MAIKAWQTRLLVDGYDFSGDTKGLTLSFAVGSLEANTLQSAAAKRIPGAVDGTLECQGYWDAAGAVDAAFYARLGSETGCVVSVLFDTRAVGNPAYTQRTTWNQQMKVDSPVDNLVTLDSTWQDNTDRGYFVADAKISATGGQTVCDFRRSGDAGRLGGAACDRHHGHGHQRHVHRSVCGRGWLRYAYHARYVYGQCHRRLPADLDRRQCRALRAAELYESRGRHRHHGKRNCGSNRRHRLRGAV